MKTKYNNIEIALSKRLTAVFILVTYITVSSPVSLIAGEMNINQKDNDYIEEISEKLITAKDGGTIKLGNAMIEIPQGAVKKDTKISISRLSKVSDTGDSLFNAIPKSGGYRFLPAGTQFEKEVTVTLPYSKELNSKPQALEDLYTYFYDTKKKQWVKLERLEVDKEKCLVHSLTTHFTDMINATLTLPESASPVDVNLNSIKNLEAAKPDGHLIKFNQPQASNTGDATFSFELGLPSGRRGMQPQISVSYSSAGGNGIMGKGFDVNYGSVITTDTRFGLPKYDTNDTYMLDGILLKEESRSGTNITYTPKKETSFSRIVRIGAGTDNDYWEVTDKSGTKRIFGTKGEACVGSGKNKYSWYLTKTQDVFGNCIDYDYVKEEDKEEDNVDGYVYPSEISYTGKNDAKGNYHVKFNYDENNIIREDVRIDARSKKLVYCKKLLTSITTHYKDNTALRTYSFKYKDGLAKEKMLTSLKITNNADGIYEYSFVYRSLKMDDKGNIKYFADAVEWKNGKPLSAGGSENSGTNFNTSAGVGYGTHYIDARITGGLSGSSSSSSSHTDVMLIDIDGDGRVDSVRQKGKNILATLNTSEGFSATEQPLTIVKGSFDTELDKEHSNTSTFGWNVYGGGGLKAKVISASLGASYSEVYQKTSSDVSCTFMDMDRDGLVDIIESGKKTYLKNLGGLKFAEVPLYTDVVLKDVSQTIPEDKAKQFKETYFVQTPFRMWKAPYDGIINIKENASGFSNNYKPEKAVAVKTFHNQNEKDLLSSNVPNSGSITLSENNIAIKKWDNFYFVSDSGDEPINSDIEWNTDIEYTSVRLFKNVYPLPNICTNGLDETYSSPYSVDIDTSYNPSEKNFKNARTSAENSFVENVLHYKELLVMYSVEQSSTTTTDASNTSHVKRTAHIKTTFKRKNNWATDVDEETRIKIFEILCDRGNILPGVLTHKQFNKYLEEIKNTSTQKDAKYYTDFVMNFTHIITEDVFILKITNEDDIKKFAATYPMSKELLMECLSENAICGIQPDLSSNKAIYKKNIETAQNISRTNELTPGTIYGGKNGTEKYLVLGNNNGSLFVYDTVNKQILNGSKYSLTPVSFLHDAEDHSTSDNNLDVEIKIKKDSKNVYESSLFLNFKDVSYRANCISNAEYTHIYNDMNVPFSNVYDKHWKIDENNPLTPGEEESLFINIELTESEKQTIIDSLYEIIEVEAQFDNNGNEVKPAYSYYAMKENADYKTAQDVLTAYKSRVVENILFPFYEKSDDFWTLKNEWSAEKTKNEVFDENRSSEESKITDSLSEYDTNEKKIELVNSYFNLELKDNTSNIDKILEKYLSEYIEQETNRALSEDWNEYQRMNKILLTECKKFNLGSYASYSAYQIFEPEHLYNIKEDGTCSVMMAEAGLSFNDVKVKLNKTKWNSSTDYSIEDFSTKKEVYSYIEKIEKEEGKEAIEGVTGTEVSTVIDVENDEFLYGGKNNWFYGFWKGSQTKYPFNSSKLTLNKFKSKADGVTSKEAFKNLEDKQQTDTSEKANKNAADQDVTFYLPQTKSQSALLKDVEKVDNATIPYSIDYKETLLGTICIETELVATENGKNSINKYAMPFIYKDIIHTERAGGNAFYNVEGLYKTVDETETAVTGAPLILPTVRRTFTEGTDKTPGVSAGLGIVPKENNDLDEIIKKTSKSPKNFKPNRESSELLSGSVSIGTNESTSITSQSIQDMNGDGIPDIIQADNGPLTITYGTKLSDNGEISYKRSEDYTDKDYVFSKNYTHTNTEGASLNAGGAVQVITKGLGKAIGIPLPAASPSGGASNSISDNEQQKGFLDINGDGLPDYYSNSNFNISLGEAYSEANSSWNIGNITENKSESHSENFTLSIGGGAELLKASATDSTKANSLKTGASASMGGSFSTSSSTVKKMMTDINGDGLPDILSKTSDDTSFTVKYNNGNGFAPEVTANLGSWNWKNFCLEEQSSFKKMKDGEGLNLHFMQNIPIVGSVIASGMDTKPSNPYGAHADTLINNLDWSMTASLGLNACLGGNFNIGINLFVPFYIGTINITVSAGTGMTSGSSVNGASVKLTDLDGDGLPDHVLRIPGSATYWKRNLLGGENLIERINLPQGGNVSIEYEEKYGTTDNPNFKYVMSKVTVSDGTKSVLPEVSDGEHSVTTTFEYDNGYYDRLAKENYGFETVKTIFADKSYKKDTYSVGKYYAKGQLKESCMYTSKETLLSRSNTTLYPSPLALPEREENWTYEESSPNASIYTYTEYEYDGYGNCTKVTQNYGDGVKLTGKIEYNNSNTKDYIIGLPVSIRVEDENGKILRLRSGSYDSKGQLTELRQYYNDSDYAENILSYNSFGNISSVTDSRGAKLSYEYDAEENMFVTEIKQKGNNTDTYTSFIEYEIPAQTKSWEKDCNGNKLTYKYDKWQRPVKIWTSYDTESNPAVSYEYHTPQKDSDGKHELWYAITNNKVTFDKEDDSVIQTVLQIDGVGRAVRTAKTGFVEGIEGWNASGAVEYDNKGRTVKEGMTEFIEGTLEDLLNSKPEMTSLYTSYKYDQKDRKIKTVLPDKSEQTNAFYIEENRQISRSKDPNDNISIQETDSRGNIVRVEKEDSSNHQLTEVTYEYNAMGEMLKAFDAKKHPVSVEYDLLGRKTALESLDSGRQEFFYDKSSNLVKETNSVLREHNKQILYEYDGLNRLVKVNYPDTKDTVYTYGGAGAANGAAGKILKTEDASGTLEYEYGSLGEVTKETRTLKTYLGSGGTKDAVMEYRSDYLGRMQWILYPDGEKVIYGYDKGGQVVSVTGKYESRNEEFNYVTDILYDQYGQRTRIDYGNGTFTEYKYDPARRWLDTIKTQNKWGQSYQNIVYDFDRVGNVRFYENNCLDNVNGNYKTRQEYTYDSLYQLIKVNGYTTYNPYASSVPEFESEYTQEFEFDADGLGNMMSKISTETVTPQKTIGDNLNYSFNYVYDKNYAHRLLSAGDRYYQYDSNGNVTCEQDGSFDEVDVEYHNVTEESENVYSSDYAWAYFKDNKKKGNSTTRYHRTYAWDEKNRLINSTDSSYNTSYVYGQDGQRSNKYTQSSETLYFNKMWTFHTDSGNSVYGGQTAKNIYLGETRIVTKLNSGTTPTYQEEFYKQYYYHSDHLGSASLISDYKGDEYQRIEYTPYGETWVEKTDNTGLEFLPYKFTAKEQDEETGLYYYGARYLDSRYSRWISTDPALGDYTNKGYKGTSGGLYNSVNFNLYHYSGNNPITYTDPDGNEIINASRQLMQDAGNATLGKSSTKIKDEGCVLTAYTRMASAIIGTDVSLAKANEIGVKNGLFSGKNENLLTPENGAALVNAILKENGITNTTVSFDGSYEYQDAVAKYQDSNTSDDKYFSTIRVGTHDAKGNKYDHTMNLDKDAYSFSNCGENIKVNDTSGVRTQFADDPSGRKNVFKRMDFFKITTTNSDS